MAIAAHDIFLIWGGNFLSAKASQADLQRLFASADCTTFASGGIVERTPTLSDASASITMFIDEANFGADFTPSATTDLWLTACRDTPAVGDIFHSHEAAVTEHSAIGGDVAGLQQMSITFTGVGPPILRGKGTNTGGVLHWATTTSTGAGTGSQFGSMSAGDTLYSFLHVDRATTSGTSPTLDVLVERSASDSWGAPTTVYTHTQQTDATNGFEVLSSVTGAQAEEWYRVSYTIGGSATPTFRWFHGLAIG